MKPGFALSLSFEGISLLHRAAGGWRSVGEVALDVPDLAAALGALRDKALRLEPDGLACKLIIPNAQIRYLTVQTGRAEGEARRAMVREALDGATPYAVEDLAFDISVEGHSTHVAAVARETLAEAEGFAVEHRFNPVSFVAIPGDQPFLGEPFFGVAENAGKTQVEADGIAVVVTGPAVIPPEIPAEIPAEIPDAIPEDTPAAAAKPARPNAKAAQTPDQAKPEADTGAKGQGAPKADPSPPADPQKPPREAPETAPETAPQKAPAKAPDKSGDKTRDETPQKAQQAAPAALGFSSRRGKDVGAAPTLAGARREDLPEGAAAAPAIAPDTAPDTAAKAAPKIIVNPASGQVSAPAPKQTGTPEPAGPGISAKRGTLRARAAGLLDRRKTAGVPPKPAVPAEPNTKASGPTAHPIAQPPATPGFADASVPQPPRDESERMTVFGARQRQKTAGKPRHLGLILTLVLLFFLAAVAAFAALSSDGAISRLFSRPAATPRIAADPAPVPGNDTAQDPGAETADGTTAEARPAPAQDIAQPPQLSALAPQAPADPAALPPDRTGAIAPIAEDQAAAGHDAPQAPELTDTDSAVLDALRGDTGAAPTEPLDTAALDPELAAEPDPELEPEPEPDPDSAAAGPADAGTETLYAATGIWPDAPDEPETPAIIGLDDLYVASIDRTDLSQDAVALPGADAFATDASLNAVTSPAAAGTAFALDDRGLVTPTPEGAVTPDGITVYLGRPPVAPPATPARLTQAAESVAEADALRQRLAGLRPRARPGDLVEQTERAQLGGRSRVELGRLRPRTRPASAQEATAPGAPATAQAVASALIPKPRPRDFQATVRSSDRASIGVPGNLAAGAPAATTAVATVAPKIPSSASVARQATLKNEINLRQVNLIGVYGTAANRRALVRLPSGRYKKVKVGDSIDGGRVLAIGESQLQYQKGGRNHTLKMPKG
ncbi:hypothetical protein [Antarcticimicrobium luteum]|uniref:hypothetical protein n=1 Tax=Antarcticimicrobium luteum TaxID=2547397 RepID=UPI00140E542D|nr:hypothetical protein [Antarcticimicrobium luteum]